MFALFEKIKKSLSCLIIWILYVLAHAVSMYCILPVDVGFLVVDAVIHATILAVLGFLIWHILLYGKYERLLLFQQFINYIALSILTILLWLSLGYLLNYLIYKEIAMQFIPTLPIRGMIGLLIYVIFILLYLLKKKDIVQKNTDANTDADANKMETDIVYKLIDKIAVKTGKKLHIIPIKEIVYIQSDGDYVKIITEDGTYLKEQTMKYFETHLPKNSFTRVHRSYIVNTEYIARIESYSKQNQQITLKTGQWLKVSLPGYRLLKGALGL